MIRKNIKEQNNALKTDYKKACKAVQDAKAEYKRISAEVREEFERGRKPAEIGTF